MPPILHIVRHGQGYHEITENGHMLHDPELTPRGIEESKTLSLRFPYHDKVDLLLASPMRRTIQTALTAFSPVVERGLRVLAVPSAQEATAENSDVGSDVETIKGWFGDRVDLSLLKPGWNDKVGDNACDVKTIMSRARQLRTWIKERPEKEIVLVSHGRFAHYLTGEVDAEGVQTTAYWINDEFRTYEFVDDASDPGEAMIAETEEGRIRREQVLMEKMAEPSQP